MGNAIKAGKKILDFGRSGLNKVVDIGSKAKDWISKGYNTVKSIPIIGDFVDQMAGTNIPLINMSAKDIAGGADRALGVAQQINRIVNPEQPPPRMPLPPTPLGRMSGVALPRRPY